MNPSSGGCWERLIRIVKTLSSETLIEVEPRVTTLQRVLVEAENTKYSRPLTDLPMSHEEDEPLTPNHFLLGCVNSTQTWHPVDETICLRKQWRIVENLKDRIWKRWTATYVSYKVAGENDILRFYLRQHYREKMETRPQHSGFPC